MEFNEELRRLNIEEAQQEEIKKKINEEKIINEFNINTRKIINSNEKIILDNKNITNKESTIEKNTVKIIPINCKNLKRSRDIINEKPNKLIKKVKILNEQEKLLFSNKKEILNKKNIEKLKNLF